MYGNKEIGAKQEVNMVFHHAFVTSRRQIRASCATHSSVSAVFPSWDVPQCGRSNLMLPTLLLQVVGGPCEDHDIRPPVRLQRLSVRTGGWVTEGSVCV